LRAIEFDRDEKKNQGEQGDERFFYAPLDCFRLCHWHGAYLILCSIILRYRESMRAA
jgi:hypothetical protein